MWRVYTHPTKYGNINDRSIIKYNISSSLNFLLIIFFIIKNTEINKIILFEIFEYLIVLYPLIGNTCASFFKLVNIIWAFKKANLINSILLFKILIFLSLIKYPLISNLSFRLLFIYNPSLCLIHIFFLEGLV